MMRLFCTFVQNLSHLLFPPPDHSGPPRLTCVLQASALPNQELEVRSGGQQVPAHREDAHVLFSWQCEAGTLMDIHLHQHGRATRSWRGRWDGQQAIQHGGTLDVEVLLEQARLAATTAPPPEFPPPQVHSSVLNGHHAEPGLSDTAAGPGFPPQPLAFGGQNLVILASGQRVPLWPDPGEEEQESPQAAGNASEADHEKRQGTEVEDLWMSEETVVGEEELLTEEEEENEDAEGDLWDGEEEATETAEEEPWEDKETETPEGQPTGMEEVVSPTAELQAREERPLTQAPSSIKVATAHVATEETLHALSGLLAAMPASTVVVDLRQHPKAGRRAVREAEHACSKERLRASFGARYWERGSLVHSTLHAGTHPSAGQPQVWRSVITNLDDPGGVRALLTALHQGYSMVLLDSRAAYTESVRCAVLTYLKAQMANLTVVQEQ